MISLEDLEIEADRAAVRLGGLRQLIYRAWDEVVPSERRWNWHLDAISEHLDAVRKGEITELVINVPPGCTKTLAASVFWPAHLWIEDPTHRIICATYGQFLSNQAAKLHVRLVKSDWFQARWPDVKLATDAVQKIETTAGGFRFSTSVMGAATGQHAGTHIGDDLAKAQDASGRASVDPVALERANDFWFSSFKTRRSDASTLRRVLIAQRLHDKDTPGKALAAGYVGLVLPMEYDSRRRCRTAWTRQDGSRAVFADPREGDGIWTPPPEPTQTAAQPDPDPVLLNPARFSRAVVDGDKDPVNGMGAVAFGAQMNQDPTPLEGAIFKHVGGLRWAEIPKNARRIITVDAAFKDTKTSDFVAIQVWAVALPNFYLLDQEYGRFGFGATCAAVARVKDRHPGTVGIYIEDKANGPAIIETLSAKIPGVIAWTPTGSKVARAEAVAPLFERNVYIPPEATLWTADYVKELRQFPRTKHDDQVDATTMALLILHQPMVSQYADAVAKMLGR